MTAGTTRGIISTGSITSRSRVFMDRAESKVPTIAMPRVATGIIRMSWMGTLERLKTTAKMGMAMASTIMTNRKLLMVLEMKITSRP